jgi:hemolysin activation/secretion protein
MMLQTNTLYLSLSRARSPSLSPSFSLSLSLTHTHTSNTIANLLVAMHLQSRRKWLAMQAELDDYDRQVYALTRTHTPHT